MEKPTLTLLVELQDLLAAEATVRFYPRVDKSVAADVVLRRPSGVLTFDASPGGMELTFKSYDLRHYKRELDANGVPYKECL